MKKLLLLLFVFLPFITKGQQLRDTINNQPGNTPRFLFYEKGEKLNGATVAPDPERHDGTWERLWIDGEWNTDTAYCWVQVVKKQIDLVHSIGGNAIHMKGSYGTFESYGLCSGVTYPPSWHWDVPRFLRNLQKVISYCASQNMYYYMGLSGVEAYLAVGELSYCAPTYEQYLQQDSVVLSLLERNKATVAGVDLLNESALWLDDTRVKLNLVGMPAFKEVIAAKYANARKFTTLPLTYSINHRSSLQGKSIFTSPFIYFIAPYCDFFDFHLYYNNGLEPAPGDIQPLLKDYPGKQVWIGEYGGFMADTSMRGKNARGVQALMELPEIQAAFMFEVKPHGSGYEDYGMWDRQNNARLDVIEPFKRNRKQGKNLRRDKI